jgi:hypothetical protein
MRFKKDFKKSDAKLVRPTKFKHKMNENKAKLSLKHIGVSIANLFKITVIFSL